MTGHDRTQLSPLQGLGGSGGVGREGEKILTEKEKNDERDSGGGWILRPIIFGIMM